MDPSRRLDSGKRRRARKIVTRSIGSRLDKRDRERADTDPASAAAFAVSSDSEDGGVPLQESQQQRRARGLNRGRRPSADRSNDQGEAAVDRANVKNVQDAEDEKQMLKAMPSRRSLTAQWLLQSSNDIVEEVEKAQMPDQTDSQNLISGPRSRRWGTEWTAEFSHNRFLPAFQQDAETSRHAMVREFSLTLVKHFAIMSAWTSLEQASKLLKHRVVQRRRDQKFRKNGQAGHITAADIKCVLLKEVKLPSAGMSWNQLAHDGLRR